MRTRHPNAGDVPEGSRGWSETASDTHSVYADTRSLRSFRAAFCKGGEVPERITLRRCARGRPACASHSQASVRRKYLARLRLPSRTPRGGSGCWVSWGRSIRTPEGTRPVRSARSWEAASPVCASDSHLQTVSLVFARRPHRDAFLFRRNRAHSRLTGGYPVHRPRRASDRTARGRVPQVLWTWGIDSVRGAPSRARAAARQRGRIYPPGSENLGHPAGQRRPNPATACKLGINS
jgi:hypothetical protein